MQSNEPVYRPKAPESPGKIPSAGNNWMNSNDGVPERIDDELR
jgi:hypothetical protein